MRKFIGILIFALTMGFAGTAMAQDAGPVEDSVEEAQPMASADEVPDLDKDPVGFFKTVYDKFKNGEWMMVFGGLLIGIVWVVRKLLTKMVSWFGTKLGGYVTSFGTALLLAVGTSLLAGQGVSLALVFTAMGAAFAASGGWEALNDVLSKLFSKDTEVPKAEVVNS